MSAQQVPRPMAICELCFLDDHTRWEPESVDENGMVLMRLIGVDTPNRLSTEVVETCCMCGSITVSGIFEMRVPNEVYFLEDNQISNNYVMCLEDNDFEDDEEDYF